MYIHVRFKKQEADNLQRFQDVVYFSILSAIGLANLIGHCDGLVVLWLHF